MKWIFITIIAVFGLVACKKKAVTNDSIVTYSINGQEHSTSGNTLNAIYETYSSGAPKMIEFAFWSNSNDLSFTIGSFFYANDFLLSDLSGVSDSAITGKSYIDIGNVSPDEFYYSGGPSFGSYSYWQFYSTISSYHGNEADGTFSGMIVGVNQQTGETIRDSIENGIFRNIPIIRTYY